MKMIDEDDDDDDDNYMVMMILMFHKINVTMCIFNK